MSIISKTHFNDFLRGPVHLCKVNTTERKIHTTKWNHLELGRDNVATAVSALEKRGRHKQRKRVDTEGIITWVTKASGGRNKMSHGLEIEAWVRVPVQHPAVLSESLGIAEFGFVFWKTAVLNVCSSHLHKIVLRVSLIMYTKAFFSSKELGRPFLTLSPLLWVTASLPCR